MNRSFGLLAVSAATLAFAAACGGGGGSDAPGTMRLALTDAPACGYDQVWVTVERVRVHRSASAGDTDSGWVDFDVVPPKQVDLLTLTNGTLLPLGEEQLPAGTYTQMRLVLAANAPGNGPWANMIVPTGGTPTELTTPSGQQSGLKMNVDLKVQPDTVADFAIDFNACKSFVKAGNSGKYLLKPVLSVIPIVSSKIVGYVDPALANGNTGVSAQQGGVALRNTAPDPATGRFELPWMPVGNYDLVLTAPGRVNAVMTGVPVTAAGITTIGSPSVRLSPPASASSAPVAGRVTPSANADVRALQVLTSGTQMEVGYAGADAVTGAYAMTLPLGAPASVAYAASAAAFAFTSDGARAGRYTLQARSGTATQARELTLPVAGAVDFVFP